MKDKINLENLVNINVKRLSLHYNIELLSVMYNFLKAYTKYSSNYVIVKKDNEWDAAENIITHSLIVLNRLYSMKRKSNDMNWLLDCWKKYDN